MIEGLKPYPQYKDSGDPFIGEIPSGWSSFPISQVARLKTVTNQTNRELLSVYLNRGVVKFSEVSEKRTNVTSEDLSKYQAVDPGDLVLNNQQAWRGSVGVSNYRGIVSPAYLVLTLSSKYDSKYANILFRDRSLVAQYLVCSKGVGTIQRNLYWPHLKRVSAIIPPPDEQAAIVKFLDYANGKIERAIRAKRKLIGLLNEQKQAIIHRAVTRGLDPNVKLKPSGIPWLGDVPEHWTLKRFKYIATINAGQVDPRKPKYRNMILIAPNHIRSGDGHLIEKETAADQGADSGKYMVTSGQIIYSKIRPNLRKATIAPCDCLCSADMYAISPKTSELSTDFLLALLLSQAFTKFAVDCSMRVAMPKVNRDALANCMLWFPGLSEQIEILQNVGDEVAPFDTAISRTQREIDLLLEYRTTLTAEVVTGKLDVREAAKRLPDHADEPLPPDDSMDEMIEDEIDQEDDA